MQVAACAADDRIAEIIGLYLPSDFENREFFPAAAEYDSNATSVSLSLSLSLSLCEYDSNATSVSLSLSLSLSLSEYDSNATDAGGKVDNTKTHNRRPSHNIV